MLSLTCRRPQALSRGRPLAGAGERGWRKSIRTVKATPLRIIETGQTRGGATGDEKDGHRRRARASTRGGGSWSQPALAAPKPEHENEGLDEGPDLFVVN